MTVWVHGSSLRPSIEQLFHANTKINCSIYIGHSLFQSEEKITCILCQSLYYKVLEQVGKKIMGTRSLLYHCHCTELKAIIVMERLQKM